MKKKLIYIILIFTASTGFGQQIGSLVFASGGHSTTNSGIQITGTIGQFMGNLHSTNSKFSLSSGVQQPEINVKPINSSGEFRQIEASCYPNPFKNTINIRIKNPDKQQYDAKLFDITGRQIRIPVTVFSDNNRENYSVDLSKLSEGQYIIKLINTEQAGLSAQFKILKLKK